MKDKIIEIIKLIRQGKIVPVVIGNIIYFEDAETRKTYRAGEVKMRSVFPTPEILKEEEVFDGLHCPVCGAGLNSNEAHHPNFCPSCGIHLDWELWQVKHIGEENEKN